MRRWNVDRLTKADEFVAERLSDASARRRGERTRRSVGEFLKGPIPLRWLTAAAALPGKALVLGLALWFRRGVTGDSSVTVNSSLRSRFGIDRYAFYRALRQLQHAGLVGVRDRPGKVSVVSIIEIGTEPPVEPVPPVAGDIH